MNPIRPTHATSFRRGAPYLRSIASLPDRFEASGHPFNVRSFKGGINLEFRTNVTFLVGENGSGKSTLLEAIAEICGFNPEGGNRDHNREVGYQLKPGKVV